MEQIVAHNWFWIHETTKSNRDYWGKQQMQLSDCILIMIVKWRIYIKWIVFFFLILNLIMYSIT